MALTVKDNSSNSDFELTPAGNHIARCYAVVDLGMQTTFWQGEEKTQHKVRISWELPNAHMEDGRPFSISANYTLSLSEKANLRKILQSWRGRNFTAEELEAFDLFTILEAPAMVNVIHNTSEKGKVYANVGSVSPLPAGMEASPLANTVLRFSLEEFNQTVFDGLPEWLKDKINTKGVSSQNPHEVYDNTPPEYRQSEAPTEDAFEDSDIPFSGVAA